MSLSCVIATSALRPGADTHLSSGRVPYGDRAWLLRSVILPLYTKWCPDLFREVVVVGEWEEGEGYTYVPMDSFHGTCADALLKRQAGYEALTEPRTWVVFQHDDHLYDPRNLVDARESADVLSPSRWTAARNVDGEHLPDGGTQYLNGHCSLIHDHVLRVRGFRWDGLPPVFTWDIESTKELTRLGQRIRYAPELKVWDLERGAAPWQ